MVIYLFKLNSRYSVDTSIRKPLYPSPCTTPNLNIANLLAKAMELMAHKQSCQM